MMECNAGWMDVYPPFYFCLAFLFILFRLSLGTLGFSSRLCIEMWKGRLWVLWRWWGEDLNEWYWDNVFAAAVAAFVT